MGNPFDIEQVPRELAETTPYGDVQFGRVHVALLRCIELDNLVRRGYRFFTYTPSVRHTIVEQLTARGLIEWRTVSGDHAVAHITDAGKAFLK